MYAGRDCHFYKKYPEVVVGMVLYRYCKKHTTIKFNKFRFYPDTYLSWDFLGCDLAVSQAMRARDRRISVT